MELVRRIHGGSLGEIVCGAAYYYCPLPNYAPYPNASPEELRIRQWLRDRAYSGDIIVEQNIHAIDICNWVMNAHPVKAVGTGGRDGRSATLDGAFEVSLTTPKELGGRGDGFGLTVALSIAVSGVARDEAETLVARALSAFEPARSNELGLIRT